MTAATKTQAMNPATPMPAPVAAAVTKMQVLRQELTSRFIEREDAVLSLLIAAISRHHVVMLGPAGEAKSNLTDALIARISGGTTFKTLLARDSKTEQVLGPIKLSGLEQDRYARKLDGRLAAVSIAFLDEVFKCNSTVLNALLGILNEREVEDDGIIKQAPLEFAVGASNEMPNSQTGDALDALWDRFGLRLEVRTLSLAGHQQFMQDELARRQARAQGQDVSGRAGTQVSLAELHTLQQAALAVVVPDEVLDIWYRIREALDAKGHARPSTRRSGWILDIICAHALLHGRMTATADDLNILAHVLWNDPAEARDVASIVYSVASPLMADAQALYDRLLATVEKCLVTVRSAQATDVQKAASIAETRKAVVTLGKEMAQKRDAAKGQGRDITRLEQMLADARAKKDQVTRMADEVAGGVTGADF
jgi:MoxR-like ATPase